MLLKKALSLTAAAAAALSLATFTVHADEEEEKREIIKFEADGKMVVHEMVPALSFDSEKYEDYIHLTKDADKAGIKFSQDKDTYYQGISLGISVDTEGVKDYMPYTGTLNDSEGNQIYPDAPDRKEIDKLSLVGVELHCEDFGMTSFDGCFITFMYRMTAEDMDVLGGKNVWVYAAGSDDKALSNMPVCLTANDTLDDNISQYRKGMIQIPEATEEEGSATKVVFDIPVISPFKGDVLYLDNITIQVPVGDSDYIMNLDNYNANAEPREIIDTLKTVKKGNTEGLEEKVEKTSEKTSPVIIVVIVVAVIVVGIAVFFVIKKLRNRFY